MSAIDDALALADRGWSVFPCRADKRPATKHGFKDATTDPDAIRAWWEADPDYLVGVAVPMGWVVVDIDDWEKFAATGLDLPETFMQQTRSGGWHAFYRQAPGQPVPKQQVKRHPGVDTRVGGAGYVVAWEPSQIPATDDPTVPEPPEWSVAEEEKKQAAASDDAEYWVNGEGFTTRPDLLRMAGNMRHIGLGWEEIAQALAQARASGKIVDGDPSRPWTNSDFIKIAQEMGSKPAGEIGVEFTVKRVGKPKPVRQIDEMDASELMKQDFPPLQYMVDGIMTEGLGIVAGAPKVGKSWLVLQAAIAVACGVPFLGHSIPTQRPVLYYALEDGKRRLQSRIGIQVGAQSLDLRWLVARWDAPLQGAGLEEEVAAWLDSYEEPGLVIIDVFAKIKPVSKGKGTAYDEDYAVLAPLHNIIKERPGTSLVLVTHDRKAGSEDFLTTVTGSRGIVGAADWIWVVKRDRLQADGVVNVTGRDIEDEKAIHAKFVGGIWVVDNKSARPGRNERQRNILETLRTQGDLTAVEILEYLETQYAEDGVTPLSPTTIMADPENLSDDEKLVNSNELRYTREELNKLDADGLVTKIGHLPGSKTIIWHAVTEAERKAAFDAMKAAEGAALADNGHGVRVSRARPREG